MNKQNFPILKAIAYYVNMQIVKIKIRNETKYTIP